MAFMEREITSKQLWYQVDGNYGTDFIPAEVVSNPRVHRLTVGAEVNEDYPTLLRHLVSCVKDYTENTDIYSVTLIEGYGSRLSAPGYMDCTEWGVYDSPEEAEDALSDMYGDEEED